MKRLFSPGMEKGQADVRRALELVLPYFRRHALQVCGGFLTLVAVDFLQLLIPRVIKAVVDGLRAGTATPSRLALYAGLILLIAVFIAALRYFWRRLILGFSRLVELNLRNRMVSHILTLDRAFFQRKTAGEIMALATNDLSSVQLATGMGLVAAVDAGFMGLAAIAFMAYIHPGLTALAVAPMPILAVLTRLLSRRLHRRFKKVQEQFSHLTEFARSTFSSIRLIKAYNQEVSQGKRFEALGEAYVGDNVKLAVIYGTLFPISGFIGNLGLLLVLLCGGKMTIGGELTAGDFVAFVNYLFLMTWPMMALGWVSDLFQRGITSLDRIRNLLDEQPRLQDPVPDAPLPRIQGRITLKGLSFTYPGQREPALEDIHLDLPPGSFWGIVGRTGAGKTTLCHLLDRLYPVQDGTYFLDGRDVNRLPLSAVRKAVAYVPQDVVLFSDTIARNLCLGKPEAGREEMIRAARAAAIHDEILAMKDGYETLIGEKGIKLSGGQRQRLAIARALLLDRPILLIDDGLSAVDVDTEQTILRSIGTHLRGRTCIVVSHRIAPLEEAQGILVMEEGRIVDRGTHAELLQRSRYYGILYGQQGNGDPGRRDRNSLSLTS